MAEKFFQGYTNLLGTCSKRTGEKSTWKRNEQMFGCLTLECHWLIVVKAQQSKKHACSKA